MKLLEYKAREIFGKFGLTVYPSFMAQSVAEIREKIGMLKMPVVVKAQVLTGGRGKAGGVKFADTPEEALAVAGPMFGMKIKDLTVDRIMVAEKAEGTQEYYLSVTLDRVSKYPIAIFSACGGVDIEEIAATQPEKIIRVQIDPLIGVREYIAKYIVSKSGIGDEMGPALYDTIKKLYKAFIESDCLLAEINPLLRTEANGLVAADGKITVDDSALFRQPDLLALRDSLEPEELVQEARRFNFLYIPISEEGSVAVVSNGSGMIMTCMDSLRASGIRTCCALDLGGGATAERIAEAVRILMSNPQVKTLFISIFGGITRCDEVANGIRAAIGYLGQRKMVIRIEGTNKAAGLEILKGLEGNVIAVDSILEGVARLAGSGGKS